MTTKIVKLPQQNLADVPVSLRKLADLIETSKVPPALNAIVVCEGPDDRLTVYGYGETRTFFHTVGLLQAAVNSLLVGD